jgi:hypothetical protein
MIKAKDGEVEFRGTRSHVLAEATTVLCALKETVSEEEYKMVIRLADKDKEQLSDEAKKIREETEKMKEELKKLLGL